MKSKFLLNNNTVKLNEEAHFFSYFYNTAKLPYGTADDLIKRMWTAIEYTTVCKGDEKYPIWHVLSGKGEYIKIISFLDKILMLDNIKQRNYLGKIFLWNPIKQNKRKQNKVRCFMLKGVGGIKGILKFILKKIGLFDVAKHLWHKIKRAS